MAEFPALPVFTDALLADTDHLSDAEFGLYMRILIQMWRSPACRLPMDIDFLSRKFKRSKEDIEKQVKPLMLEFMLCDGSWYSQKRLMREFEYLIKRREKARGNANKRWNNDIPSCQGNAKTMLDSNAPHPTPPPKKVEGKPSTYSSDFESAWKIYPRKDGSKSKAFEFYQREIRGGVKHEAIIDGIRRYCGYITATGAESTKIAHAATWLNQRRWESDYSIQSGFSLIGGATKQQPTKDDRARAAVLRGLGIADQG